MAITPAITWLDVLRDAGYPTTVVVLDWETYYDERYNLAKMSTVEYVLSEQFEELGIAVAVSQGAKDAELSWSPNVRVTMAMLTAQFGPRLDGCTTVMQNARFDCSVLAFRYEIRPLYVVDTRGLSLHHNAHESSRLKDMAIREGLPPKLDGKRFLGWTRRRRIALKRGRSPTLRPILTAEMEAALAEYAVHDARLEWELFKRMLPRLSRPNVELRLMQHTLEMFTRPCLRVDAALAERIAAEMEGRAALALETCGHDRAAISGNISFERLMGEALAEQNEELPRKMNKDGTKAIPALAKTDEAREKLLSHPSEKVRRLMEARVALKTWPSKAKRVRKIAAQAAPLNGLLPVPLVYHGAHTGRWSGDEDINLQNLGKRGDSLDARVREVLLPPEGDVLVIADATAIEARGTAWLAGEEKLCHDFTKGRDVYCEFASQVLRRPVRKPAKTDPDLVADRRKRDRFLGKIGVLGCGYGLGPLKCIDYAKGYGLDLSLRDATAVVQTYRQTFSKIVRLWSDVERAFKYTCRSGRPSMLPHLRFEREEDERTTVIVLPSGRRLRYVGAHIFGHGTKGEHLRMPDGRRKGRWIYMWGGFLVENIVQAFCRDILAEAVRSVDAGGWRVVLHVHDEIVAVAPKDRAEDCLRDVIEALRRQPEWGTDLPLDAEGRIRERYD